MPAFVPFHCSVPALAFEVAFESGGLRRGTNGIATSGRDEDGCFGETRLILWRPRNERMHEDERVEQVGRRKRNRGENVGAVRVAKADRAGPSAYTAAQPEIATGDANLVELFAAFPVAHSAVSNGV